MILAPRRLSRKGGVVLWALVLVTGLLFLASGLERWLGLDRTPAHATRPTEAARAIAEMAVEEILADLARQLPHPQSAWHGWILRQAGIPAGLEAAPSRAPTPDPQADAPPLSVRQTAMDVERALAGRFRTTISCRVSLQDVCDREADGTRFPGRNILGSMRFEVTVALVPVTPGASGGARATLTRRHDLKVVALVSGRQGGKPRAGYAPGFPLDYALFVRQGVEEFAETGGGNLNPERVQISVSTGLPAGGHAGRVFLGEPGGPASGPGLFLNLDDRRASLIPPAPGALPHRIDLTGCLTLLPALAQVLEENGIPAGKALAAMEGAFEIQHLPAAAGSSAGGFGVDEETRRFLAGATTGPAANFRPGIDLLAAAAFEPAAWSQLLETPVGLRFLRLSRFRLKLDGLPPEVREVLPGTFPLPCPVYPTDRNPPAAWKEVREPLARILEKLPPTADPVSRFESTQPGDRAAGPVLRPVFFNPRGEPVPATARGPAGLRCFGLESLWTRRLVSGADLEKAGMIDSGVTRLRLEGICSLRGDLTLGLPGQDLRIRGQGALVTDGRIVVAGNLRKSSPDDLLVLVSRAGEIELRSQVVEASLISLGDGKPGKILPRAPCRVYGAVAVDRLGLEDWASGTYEFAYDPGLSSPEDRLQIFLSKAFSGQSWVEAAE